MLVFVWMSVTPIPVSRLLLLVRFRVIVRILVIFRKVRAPGAIFVVVPVVIVLMVSIVDSNLNAGLLGYARAHD